VTLALGAPLTHETMAVRHEAMRTKLIRVVPAVLLLASLAGAAEKTLTLKDLPPAARKSAEEIIGDARVLGVRAETREGLKLFVVETSVGTRRLDLQVDDQGRVLEIREELALAAVPAVPRAALEKEGTVRKVRSVMRKTGITYEAQVESGGKLEPVVVGSDGKPRPEASPTPRP
jgi:hypothetical protein